MQPSSPGLSRNPPSPKWLEGPHGRLAFFPYPAPDPWLHLLISHGFSEHSGWWHHVAEAFCEQGISAYLFDHYHHGQSEGAPGDVGDFDILTAGLAQVLREGVAPFRGDDSRLVILGHSNGALAALHGLASPAPPEAAGLVLASPFLGMPRPVAFFHPLIMKLMSFINPRFAFPIPRRPHSLTANKEIWDHYDQDPLRFGHITARFFMAMRRALQRVRSSKFSLPFPLLVLCSDEERVVSLDDIRHFFQRVGCEDKTLKEFIGFRHELFNETRWEEVVSEVVRWAESRFRASDSQKVPP
ncbi:MAG: lysophospholipase [bacterium]